MIYPATIIGVAFLVIIFMLTFVIPTFASMFKGLGAELPLPTQIVLWMSDFVRGYILLIIAAIVGSGLRAPPVLRDREWSEHHRRVDPQGAGDRHPHPQGRRWRASPDLRHPRVLRRAHPEGLRITARTAGNKVVEKAVMQCRAAVTAGKTLARAAQGLRRVPTHGHPDDLGRRADGRPRRDAREDRRLLRRRGGHRGGRAHRAARAAHDRRSWACIIGGLVVAMYLPIFRLVTLIK